MAKVTPFKGVLYNLSKVSGDTVLAPPYDVISSELRERLYQMSPYNVVRIDFGKELSTDTLETNRYTRARDYLRQWLEQDVLVRDTNRYFYAYEAEYVASGEKKTLRGLLALVKLEELGNGVFPHEETHSKPKADRLSLMKACFGNISPIFSLYHSPERIASRILDSLPPEPVITAQDLQGASHRVYRISDPSHINAISKELSDKAIFIADGHHRYEVALEFKKEMDKSSGASSQRDAGKGEPPWNYVMMFLANIADEGITILPTHRLVRGIPHKSVLFDKLKSDFTVKESPVSLGTAKPFFSKGKNTFGLYLNSDEQEFTLIHNGTGLEDVHPALRGLDVIVLHELIFKRDLGIHDIAYEMDAEKARERVRKADFDGVFFLNPTKVEDVERVALSNLRMPPKSTYFYPKLLTGIVINSFENF